MNAFYISKNQSIQKLAVAIKQQLDTQLYAIVKLKKSTSQKEVDVNKLYCDLMMFISLIGSHLNVKSFGCYILSGKNENSSLPAHVEKIYRPLGFCRYFALACIIPPMSGGETRVFDAYKAADLLKKEYPNLKDVFIEYKTSAHPNEIATHKLISKTDEGKPLLVYRGGEKNRVIIGNVDSRFIDGAVSSVLKRSLIVSHKWEAGDILFINNIGTLHDRLPYKGIRKMLRVRFDEDDEYVQVTY